MKLCTLVAVLLPALLLPSATAAQAPDSIRGRVVGPDSSALGELEVVLHRVTDAGGASVAWDTTGAEGGFALPAPEAGAPEALYFVAVRHEGDLYIAEPFATAAEAPSPILLQVGVPGTAAMSGAATGATMPVSGQAAEVRPPVSWRRWGIALVVGLALLAVLAYVALRTRSAGPRRNRLVLQVAIAEEELEAARGAGQDTAELEQAHAEALARLRAASTG